MVFTKGLGIVGFGLVEGDTERTRDFGLFGQAPECARGDWFTFLASDNKAAEFHLGAESKHSRGEVDFAHAEFPTSFFGGLHAFSAETVELGHLPLMLRGEWVT